MSVIGSGSWAAHLPRLAGTGRGGEAGAGRGAGLTPFALVGVLAMVDLVTTICCYRAVGIREDNPLAAMLLSSGNYAGVVGLKIGSLLVFFGLLHLARRRALAAAAAWLGVVIYAAVCTHWLHVMLILRHALA